jgi:hypothetical protein
MPENEIIASGSKIDASRSKVDASGSEMQMPRDVQMYKFTNAQIFLPAE